MGNFIEGLLIGLVAVLLIGAIAVIGGTVVFIIWPMAIPAVFPGLVASGVLAAKIAWWPAVCLTWLCGILIKSTQTNNNNNK
jgi:hypothetical protein